MARLGRDLLVQARMLTQSEPRRPKQATLRRAVSTAYYGLFHFLIEESTALLLGTGPENAALRQLAGRAFIHGKMKSVCLEFLKANSQQVNFQLQPFWPKLNIGTNQGIQIIARTFIELQDERHTADYDLTVSFSRQDALNSITRAENAVVAWSRLRKTDPEICRLLAVALILWPSLANR
jgi:uncharacterized protein (UPF0332 family)